VPPLRLETPVAEPPIDIEPPAPPPAPAFVPLQLAQPVADEPEQPTVVLGPELLGPEVFAPPAMQPAESHFEATQDDADLPEVIPEPLPPMPPLPPPPPPRTRSNPPADRAQLFGDFLRPASVVPGEHRVVVHTLAGALKRGTLREADMHAEQLELWPPGGGAAERIPVSQMKAVFFMLAPGAQPPTPSGKRLTVSFEDGRQLTGFCSEPRPSDPGFFMIPADSRANTARIFVFRAAVRGLSEG
jgi:hypothetical protein